MRYILACILIALGNHVVAATYSQVGMVMRIGAIPSRNNGDFIVVEGFLSAGTCPISQGLVPAKVQDSNSGDRAYAIALAAKMAGKDVKISVDDALKNELGYCYINSLELAD